MEKREFRAGLKVFRTVLAGLERIVADPSAIARMQASAAENPALLLGPTLEDYLGMGEGSPYDSLALPEEA